MEKDLSHGITFTHTRIGQPVFIKTGAKDAHGAFFPDDWSISQLETILSYMKENPNCSLFADGSGKPVKL